MTRVRGIALVAALIVLIAMTLATAALMRAVETANAIAGNLAFRDASIPPVDAAVEEAWSALYEKGLIVDHGVSMPALGYYASRLPGEDTRGVPKLLQSADADSTALRTVAAGQGNTVRYVIERMCTGPGPPSGAQCALVRPRSSAAPTPADPGLADATVPIFRVSVRVDGPQGTVTHAHAMIRDSTPPHRMSWRVLVE
jgi:Tfp pilus assembly protein PilX